MHPHSEGQTNTTPETSDAAPAAPPPMRGGRVNWTGQGLPDDAAPPARSGPSLALFGLIGAGVVIAGIGLVWNLQSGGPETTEASTPRARPRDFFNDRVQMGRQGAQMARDVKELERQHMERIQRAIESGGD